MRAYKPVLWTCDFCGRKDEDISVPTGWATVMTSRNVQISGSSSNPPVVYEERWTEEHACDKCVESLREKPGAGWRVQR